MKGGGGEKVLIYCLLASCQAYRKLIRLPFCPQLSNRENYAPLLVSFFFLFPVPLEGKVNDSLIYDGLSLDIIIIAAVHSVMESFLRFALFLGTIIKVC